MVVNSSAMGFNPMSAFGAFNPFPMQFGPQQQGAIGGLFGGYRAGGKPVDIEELLGGLIERQGLMGQKPMNPGMGGFTDPAAAERARWEAAGGYNSGVYDAYEQMHPGWTRPTVATPEAPAKPRRDRTFTSGGIGKYATGQYEIPAKGMPNFGLGYFNTGLFGTKGLQAIKGMGYVDQAGQADQAAYLAANPNLVTKYERKNPSKTVKIDTKKMI